MTFSSRLDPPMRIFEGESIVLLAVRDQPGESVETQIEGPNGRRTRAQIADLTPEGASLRVSQPVGCARDQVVLWLQGSGLPGPIDLPAQVLHVTALRDHWRYCLDFPEGTLERLPPGLHALVPAGVAPRALVTQAPIAVRVSLPAGDPSWGHLIDISTTGMALAFDVEDDPLLLQGENVDVSLRLGEDALELVQRVRHGRLAANQVRYGLELDGRRTRDLSRQRACIERFVARAARCAPRGDRRWRPLTGRPSTGRIELSEDDLRVEISAAESGEVGRAVRVRSSAGRVRDLSTTGIGVSLPAAADPGLHAGERALVGCELDGTRVQLPSRVRRSLLIDDEVCYGLQFERDGVPDFTQQSGAIARFIESHRPS